MITLQKKDPHVVQALLFYCYRGKHSDEPPNSTDAPDNPMAFNALMYGYGEEFQMPFLKQLAQHKFLSNTMLKADMDKADFVAAIPIIYNKTPR